LQSWWDSGEEDEVRLHAWLHAACRANIPQLDALLRSPPQLRRLMVRVDDYFKRRPEPPGELLRRSCAHPIEESECLREVAAALSALDQLHLDQQALLEYHIEHLPESLGGERVLFLPPPPTPLQSLIPAERLLTPGSGVHPQTLREVLGLRWSLIALSDLPVEPAARRLDDFTAAVLESHWAQGATAVGLASPFRAMRYQPLSAPHAKNMRRGTPFTLSALRQDCIEEAQETLLRVLARCEREEITLLCFPDLALDQRLAQRLVYWLENEHETRYPTLTVCGGRHFSVDSGRQVNRCEVLDWRGRSLWAQEKCRYHLIPREQTDRLPAALLSGLELDQDGGFEDIQPCEHLWLLDTPLGRMATPLSRDYLESPLAELLVRARGNFFLVPALVDDMGPLQERAVELAARNRAASFIVNSSWWLSQLQREDKIAVACLPIRGGVYWQDHPVDDELHMFTIQQLIETENGNYH
jgi:hypothetical protein